MPQTVLISPPGKSRSTYSIRHSPHGPLWGRAKRCHASPRLHAFGRECHTLFNKLLLERAPNRRITSVLGVAIVQDAVVTFVADVGEWQRVRLAGLVIKHTCIYPTAQRVKKRDPRLATRPRPVGSKEGKAQHQRLSSGPVQRTNK
jgi:hypothetical protein